jgi:PhzF family phenazine biosynthesis protein
MESTTLVSTEKKGIKVMKSLYFKQVDVFTEVPFCGNPLAVLFGADDLSDDEMQSIANWTNLSETVFVTKSDKADYRLVIYTPKQELPFAGHPTIGSAHAVREAGVVDKNAQTFSMECKAGIVPFSMDGDTIMAQVPAPKLVSTINDTSQLIDTLGCNELADDTARVINSGPIWIVSRVASREQLDSLRPDTGKMIELSKQTGSIGLNAFALGENNQIHVRTFAPLVGIYEDPVCGSCNAAIAAYIRDNGLLDQVGSTYTACQGSVLNRDGFIRVKITDDAILIGGHSVTVVDGKISL